MGSCIWSKFLLKAIKYVLTTNEKYDGFWFVCIWYILMLYICFRINLIEMGFEKNSKKKNNDKLDHYGIENKNNIYLMSSQIYRMWLFCRRVSIAWQEWLDMDQQDFKCFKHLYSSLGYFSSLNKTSEIRTRKAAAAVHQNWFW